MQIDLREWYVYPSSIAHVSGMCIHGWRRSDLKIITTVKIFNKISWESPYISNTFSRETPGFHTSFQLCKRSPCHSKKCPGKLDKSGHPNILRVVSPMSGLCHDSFIIVSHGSFIIVCHDSLCAMTHSLYCYHVSSTTNESRHSMPWLIHYSKSWLIHYSVPWLIHCSVPWLSICNDSFIVVLLL